jgi:hypothetical protein
MKLYRYFVSQSSEFCRHNTLCCFPTSVYYCCCLFRYDSVRKLWIHPRILKSLHTVSPLLFILTNSIDKSHSEADSHSTSQEIPHNLWNPKVHYRVPRHWSLFSAIWIQFTTSHSIALRSIWILSYHPRRGLPSGLFLSGFPAKIFYAFLISPMRATCPTHLTLHDFITLITFDEVYKLWSSSFAVFSNLPPPPPC